MYCSDCGAENQDGAVYCKQCGKKINDTASSSGAAESGRQPAAAQKEGRPKGNKKTAKIVGIAVAAALVLGAIVAGVGIYRGKMEEKREQELLAQQQSEQQQREQTRQEYIAGLQAWLDGAEQECSGYVMDSAQTEEYNQHLSALKNGINDGEEAEDLERRKADLETFVRTLAAANLAQIEEYKTKLSSSDTGMALPSELETIESYQAEVENLVTQGSYGQALEKLGEWEELLAAIQVPPDTYQVSIRQYDISDYPAVKVYLDVTDQNGNFVDNLGSEAFFVNESRSIDGTFKRQQIVNATKLDENEGISISLVADVSGSMHADMPEVQRVMYNFVNTMQFDKGDEVELTEFSEYAYVCKSFTNNVDEVVQAINGLLRSQPYAERNRVRIVRVGTCKPKENIIH